MTGSPDAAVKAFHWKSQAGDRRTTLVGKLTQQLQPSGALAWVQPPPLVAFDRVSTDPRFISEACELMPWTTVASVIPYGGPLRFTLEDERGAPCLVVAQQANGVAGFSMSSEERARHAPRGPARDADGLPTIGDDVDGRFFVAAPESWQLSALRGNEAFQLELPGFSCRGRLPDVCVVVTLALGALRRSVALVPDLIVVDGQARRVSLVSRALVLGDATLISWSVVTRDQAAGLDRGDALPGRAKPRIEIADEPSEAFDIPVPATPFDPGFAPTPVLPGVGVAETLMPVDSLAAQLDALRAQLRGEGKPVAAGPAPVSDGIADKKRQ